MPLMTRIERNGEALVLRWGWFHVEAMTEVADEESGEERYLQRNGSWTVRNEYEFEDAADGEVFVIKPGDVLSMWRQV